MRVERLEHRHYSLVDDSVGIDILDIEILDNGLGRTQFLVGGKLFVLTLAVCYRSHTKGQ